ncbi:MAG TPA: helix-turn-helix domain-containing protein [Micromonosporaceae bacterium]
MAVLEALRAGPGADSVQDLADRLRLHPNTVRFHLMKLVQAGLAVEEPGESTGPGRPRLRYRATRPADRETSSPASGSAGQYQLLSQILAGYLATHSPNPADAARAAGRQWGRHLIDRPPPDESPDADEVLRRVTGMLDTLGFQPVSRDNGEIELRRCPFAAVAQRQPGVVCAVHHGLIEGAVAELDADAGESTLDAWVTPSTCLARLSLSERRRRNGRSA